MAAWAALNAKKEKNTIMVVPNILLIAFISKNSFT